VTEGRRRREPKRGPRRPPASKAKRTPRHLDREAVLRVALRVVGEEGIEAVSLRRLATELGVTPAAVHWHVRSKDDLVREIVNAVFQDFAPPKFDQPDWTGEIRELFRWLRHKFRDRIRAFGVPDVSQVMSYAFMKIGLRATHILTEAGFEAQHLVGAVAVLMRHTLGFGIFETILFNSYSPERTRKLAVNRAVGTLPQEELTPFLRYVPHMLEFDVDELFDYSLELLIDGFRNDLERRRDAARGA